MTEKSKFRGFVQLFLWGIGLWIFFGVITPRLVSLSDNWQHYNQTQERLGLDSGSLYYTNVPVSLESERANRAAVERALEGRRKGLAPLLPE